MIPEWIYKAEDMLEVVVKYVSVFFGSMFRFIAGPATGVATGLSVAETVFFTVLGMMTSVLIFSNVGEQIMKRVIPLFKRKKRLFTRTNRRLVYIWKRFGIKGVAFVTPLLLSPIVGTMVAISFGAPKKKILTFMFISALFWGLAYSLILFGITKLNVTL